MAAEHHLRPIHLLEPSPPMTSDDTHERIQRIIDSVHEELPPVDQAGPRVSDAMVAWSRAADALIGVDESMAVEERRRYDELRQAGVMPLDALAQLRDE